MLALKIKAHIITQLYMLQQKHNFYKTKHVTMVLIVEVNVQKVFKVLAPSNMPRAQKGQ